MVFFGNNKQQQNTFRLIIYGSMILILGLVLSTILSFRLPFAGYQIFIVIINGLLIFISVFNIYLLFFHFLKPIRLLLRETGETLQGIRKGGITMVQDGEIGVLANNFNQMVLGDQMKRIELENSNKELASHAEIIEKTHRELDKKVYVLSTLFNIGKELNATLSLETILKITCFTSMGQVGVTVMSIMLLEEKDEFRMICKYAKGLRNDPRRPKSSRFSMEFMKLLRLNEQPFLFSGLEGSSHLKIEMDFLSAYKTYIIAPLMAKDQVIGMLLLGKKLSGGEFMQGEKDFLATLASLSALALRNARHYEQAITDDMTKLYLKCYFQLRLEDEIKRATRYQGKITIIMMDIDYFKKINDTYGHVQGDKVLIRIGETIMDNFRDVDVAARYGGEEFSVIMPEVAKKQALIAAERLRKSVENISYQMNEKNIKVTISIGLAEFPEDGESSVQLVEAADRALYCAKENGRNQTMLA
ncbi:diguanylate cyclase [bacterium]|nr:diguanylate cyclase [bacterium]